MPEVVLLAIGLALAAAFVLAPLWRDAPSAVDDQDEAAAIRHRVALEALRDVEADHAAGLTDAPTHAAQLAEAEADAVATRPPGEPATSSTPSAPSPGARTAAVVAAAAIGLVLAVGSLIGGTGIANATVVNRSLADAQAAETARQARISDLLAAVAADPTDAGSLSGLADAYLAGSTTDDLARAAAALQLLINADPARSDAYERLMTAYLRAGDHANARAVHDSYVAIEAADPIEVAFFDGLIALRGENDPERALAAFDRFLELAPDDPRAGMILGLRAEAASGSEEP